MKPKPSKNCTMEEKIYSLSYITRISNGDEAFIIDMVNTFIENTPETIEQITEAKSKQDYMLLYKLVHKFIPNLTYVGLSETQNKFKQLEKILSQNNHSGEIRFPDELLVEALQECETALIQLKNDFN